MGSEDSALTAPVHTVTVRAFEMQRTHVTVRQYSECVSKGVCKVPDAGENCNWGVPGREDHPVNCVTWEQANIYAWFRGARLPTEAEWEYAAKSGGLSKRYPWGDAEPSKELAVIDVSGTMPVCSKPAGNTLQGLCDMAGNVSQLVEDEFALYSYGFNSDGSAFEWGVIPNFSEHVVRGGAFYGVTIRTTDRESGADKGVPYIGFRLARSLKDNPLQGAPARRVEWVIIPGGAFTMLSGLGAENNEEVVPREVKIHAFMLSKADITVDQYAECVVKGKCSVPGTGGKCNWAIPGRKNHPINCVTWEQARAFADFYGARLPSESEWEYAARGGKEYTMYPWGDAPPTPNSKQVPMGIFRTIPVCSAPLGNTAFGLCDMAGNVFQWVEDTFRETYDLLPVNGLPFVGNGRHKVVRGGSYEEDNPWGYNGSNFTRSPGFSGCKTGFRIAK